MDLIDDGLEILSEQECAELLAPGGIGRVALSIGAVPAVFPVNFAMHDTAVVFVTSAGVKLRAALEHAVVAFEVDEVDPTTRSGWSVLAVGTAREVTDPAIRQHVQDMGLRSWVDGSRDHLVSIEPEFLSGRRIAGR